MPRTYKMDFTEFEPEGADYLGGSFIIPEGEYPMKVVSVEEKVSSKNNEMFEWLLVGTGGKAKDKRFYYHTVLHDAQKLGKAVLACGIEFEPGQWFDLDLDEVEGAEVIGEVYIDGFNGQKRSTVRKIMPPEMPRTVKLTESEVKELDEEELEELVERYKLEVDLAKAKTLSKRRNVVLDALLEADLLAT
jgi:hypothetical protein